MPSGSKLLRETVESRGHHALKASACVAVAIAATATVLVAQPITLDLVLSRAERYLVDYYSRLSLIVAEERFEQWVEPVSQGRQSMTTPAVTTEPTHVPAPEEPAENRRTLVSDFLMVHQTGQAAWLGFRDVLRVNGKAVGLEDHLRGADRAVSDPNARWPAPPFNRNGLD